MMSLPQIAFISLQHELRDGDGAILARHPNVTRLRGFSDFADTAAVVAQLDCVVAVDTAVAAAAMGKPVFLLLPVGGDWHCAVRGRTSPWYPTVQLFCQHVAGRLVRCPRRSAPGTDPSRTVNPIDPDCRSRRIAISSPIRRMVGFYEGVVGAAKQK